MGSTLWTAEEGKGRTRTEASEEAGREEEGEAEMMRRTAFRRKHEPSAPREDRPMAPLRALAVKPNYGGSTSAQPIPKHEYIRSPALMKAYRAIPCQNCGKDDGTVCGAHANWGEFGKGKSIKASDEFCASLCSTCHGELDQGALMGKAERYTLWTIAHVKTVRELLARGLWPVGVPVPRLERP